MMICPAYEATPARVTSFLTRYRRPGLLCSIDERFKPGGEATRWHRPDFLISQ
jgi:hypothetical protein